MKNFYNEHIKDKYYNSAAILTTILVGLKLAGAIDWPWIWIFSPAILWAFLAVICIVYLLKFDTGE